MIVRLTLVQLKAINTETTDLEIWVSGGLVLANVGNSFLLEDSRWVQNWKAKEKFVSQSQQLTVR